MIRDLFKEKKKSASQQRSASALEMIKQIKMPKHEITLMRPEDNNFNSEHIIKDSVVNDPKLKV